MFRAIFLLYLAGIPFSRCKELHEYMTPKEVMSVFHTPHHQVPEYEVVPVSHRVVKKNGSEGSELNMKVFNDDVKLYLNPTEGILASENTPVWTVSSDSQAPEGLQYKQVPNAMFNVGITLQDVHSSSAVLLTPTPNGQIHLDGVLNNKYVIKSLPQRVLEHVLYGGHKLYDPLHTKNVTNDDEFAYTHHHVVYKLPASDQYKDSKITDPDEKHNAPDIIYPQVIVVADYSIYSLLGENIEQALKYLIAFWNGVDLRYRLLTTPKIRFNIAGIIIGTEKNATPYLENSRIEVSKVDADRALRGMADYFYRETRFPKEFYDMAIAMTHLDMCNMLIDNFCDSCENFCDPATLGYAYVAGACDRNATKESSEAVGIVEDNGGFAGIIPTAHEIGHLIGARHDGNPKGAVDCPPHDGFIMTSGLMLHENGFEWSSCSINAFYNFINQDRAKCLYNKPVTGTPVPRILPGALMSLDDQCMKVFGTKACNRDATVCTRLECEYPGIEGYCRASAAAAEGSPCGDGLICLNGKCVLEGLITEDKEKRKPLEKFIPKFILQKIKQIPWIQNLLQKLKNKLQEKRDELKDKLQEKGDKLQEKRDELKDKLQEKRDELKDKLQEKGDKLKDKLQEKGDKLQEKRDELKDKLQEKRDELKDKLQEKRDELKDKLQEKGDELQEKRDELKDKLQEKRDELKDKLQEKRDELKDKLQEKRDELKDKLQEKGDKLQEKRDELKDKLQEKRDELKDKLQEKRDELTKRKFSY